MERIFNYLLSEAQKGVALIIAGIILLLHTLGIIERGLDIIIIIGSLYMIVLGCYKMQYHKKVLAFLQQRK